MGQYCVVGGYRKQIYVNDWDIGWETGWVGGIVCQ